MDNNYVIQKLDAIDNKVDGMGLHLERYNALLEVHIKRTELLEEALKPVEQHVATVNLMAKWFAGAVGLIGTIVGIYAGLR